MNLHLHITPKLIFQVTVYWNFFWNALYCLCPPREYFNSPRYNRFLEIVSYYGSLNLRAVGMKLYGARPQDAPPTANSTRPPVDSIPPKV